MPRRMAYDGWLFFTAGLLVVAGLFMVGSASHYVAMSAGRSPHYYLFRHAAYLAAGIVALLAALHLPYRRLDDRRVVLSALAICFLSLVVVLFMPAAGGARRWIPAGLIRIQPSEVAKLVLVVFAAYLLSRKEKQVNDPWVVPIPCLAVAGLMAALVSIEPDLGSSVMLAVVVLVMLCVAGLRWAIVGGVGCVGLLGIALLVIAEPYRLQRMRTFWQPTADAQGAGFQLAQSLIAIGSGGIWGVGLGQGQQKAYYLPAAHTDFIFSVAGEELGLVGTLLLLGGFLLLFWRGMRAALRAPDRFGFYLALGITSLLVLQGLIHMAVCLGLFPTKGLPLPFISWGGSSLVVSMSAVGLLINVSQHSS